MVNLPSKQAITEKIKLDMLDTVPKFIKLVHLGYHPRRGSAEVLDAFTVRALHKYIKFANYFS